MGAMKKTAPERDLESPIPFRHVSNGEFCPPPPGKKARLAEKLFRETVDRQARRHGVSRRDFATSVLGSATALWVMNQVACGSEEETAAGAAYNVGGGGGAGGGPPDECVELTGDEFIFDVQTHHVNPAGDWREANPGLEAFFASLPQGGCGEMDPVECFDVDWYIRQMFVESDTSVAVLSALPAVPGQNPIEVDEMAVTRELVNQLADSQRLVIHGIVMPNLGQEQLDGMQALTETHGIAAWKVYTPAGGWRLDDPMVGIPFIEKGLELGVNIICCHKGLPLPGFDPMFASPEDVGIVAAQYPEMNFVVYHSAFEIGVAEGAYDPMGLGVDRLVRAVLDNGIGMDGNVYAELGSTWRFLVTAMDPIAQGHVMGKLLLHLGEDRIVWGTDSIWYGTPQPQIEAFRAFQIPQELQDQFGYPALTDTAKRKILGLNSAALYGIDPDATLCAIQADDITRERHAMLSDPKLRAPRYHAVGPATRREWIDFLCYHGGKAG
jgi:predicted TIM-barrel fold metal-dependent hydrolase